MDEKIKLTAEDNRYTVMLVSENGQQTPFVGGLSWEYAYRLHQRFGGYAVRNGKRCQLVICREVAVDVLAERIGANRG